MSLPTELFSRHSISFQSAPPAQHSISRRVEYMGIDDGDGVHSLCLYVYTGGQKSVWIEKSYLLFIFLIGLPLMEFHIAAKILFHFWLTLWLRVYHFTSLVQLHSIPLLRRSRRLGWHLTIRRRWWRRQPSVSLAVVLVWNESRKVLMSTSTSSASSTLAKTMTYVGSCWWRRMP